MPDDADAWLAALQKARASGVLSVRHGDTWTTFRSLPEIDAIIRSLQASGTTTSGSGNSGRRRLLYARQLTKGL